MHFELQVIRNFRIAKLYSYAINVIEWSGVKFINLQNL